MRALHPFRDKGFREKGVNSLAFRRIGVETALRGSGVAAIDATWLAKTSTAGKGDLQVLCRAVASLQASTSLKGIKVSVPQSLQRGFEASKGEMQVYVLKKKGQAPYLSSTEGVAAQLLRDLVRALSEQKE